RTIARNSDFRDELTLLEKTADQRPDHAFTLELLGEARYRAGLKRPAIEAWERALALKPGDAKLRFDVTMLGVETGTVKREDAVRIYRQILETRPPIPELLTPLGADLGILGRPDEATQPLSQAIELDPTLVEPVVNLATALDTLGRHDEAADV